MYANCLKRVLDILCFLAVLLCVNMHEVVYARSVLASPVFSANPSASFVNGNAYLQQGIPLLMEYHRLTTSVAKQRFAYPQRNYDFRAESPRFSTTVDSIRFGADAHLLAGLFMSLGDNDHTIPGLNLGFSASGFVDSLDFDLNAAFFVENRTKHPAHNRAGYDFSTFDRQKTDWKVWDNENRNFINYSRWQGHVGFNYAWLRLELGRDALHWGPGFYNNLTLNRQAVPYNYFSVDMVFGPLRVISFYCPLTIDSVGSRTHAHGDRNLYGHRYELALGNATFGMSEIQTIYNENSVWLLVPVYPLFMEKGNFSELNNNGALALDANYRIMRTARIYGEFYMDDFDSPITVIENEYLNSQWALMLGTQVVHDFKLNKHNLQLGSIVEYARVDQRVYTHYEPGEAQIANAGYPLGDQLGPNSQSIDWMIYAQINNALFVGVHNKWQWKGNVYGSELNGSWIGSGQNIKKDFLGGAKIHYSVTPMLAYNAERWQCSGAVTLFAEKKGEFNFSVSL